MLQESGYRAQGMWKTCGLRFGGAPVFLNNGLLSEGDRPSGAGNGPGCYFRYVFSPDWRSAYCGKIQLQVAHLTGYLNDTLKQRYPTVYRALR